ncbi:hypothetical protein OHO28_29645 [Streptomyces europaeiscabiei]|uniref:hypothetical protein n=1 Tax=Streptomyces europaeiscabiei TaxID=146819 RepID=UPI002E196596
MSIALLVAAAYLPPEEVNQGQKLALMKIADSADDETRIARPGALRLEAWIGVTEKRAITIVTELVAKGLVERLVTGKEGRSAAYRIFPHGVPDTPTRAELEARKAQRETKPKNQNKARREVTRARPSRPAMTRRDVEDREAARAARAKTVNDGGQQGGQPDPGPEEEPSTAAGFHGWNPDGREEWVPPVEPTEFQPWNPDGSTGGTPSFPSFPSSDPSCTPLTPTADAAGEPAAAESNPPAPAARCRKHTERPGANCRACGTSPRAAREHDRREASDAARLAEQERLERMRADRREVLARREADPEGYQNARLEAQRAAREGAIRNRERPAGRQVTRR